MNPEIQLQISQPLLELMRSCETFCVALCCGVGAFDVSEQQIGEWVKTAGLDQAGLARQQLQTLMDEVAAYGAAVTSDLFCASWSAQECVAWLNEWKTALEGVLQRTK
jgi:hypothetical protein